MIRALFLAVSLLIAFTASAAPLEPLTAQGVQRLLAPPARGVRVIELWALYCVYCETNLRELARLSASDPEVQAVTVSTDDISNARDAIVERLRSAHAAAVPALAYTEASPERLNYLIDPGWGGETPRTLVIGSDGSRRAVSGTLTYAQLRALATGRSGHAGG